MNRSALDKLISSTGLVIAIVLLIAAGGLQYAHNFVHSQVQSQLLAEKISFPPAGSPALTSLPPADQQAVSAYAGQQLLTGRQAEVFADHFIAVHLKKIGDGKTYADLSAAAMADPTNTTLNDQVQTIFRGETLRGLLLNAYAFDTMAQVAQIGAYVAAVAGVLLLILSALGFGHANRAKAPAKRRK